MSPWISVGDVPATSNPAAEPSAPSPDQDEALGKEVATRMRRDLLLSLQDGPGAGREFALMIQIGILIGLLASLSETGVLVRLTLSACLSVCGLMWIRWVR